MPCIPCLLLLQVHWQPGPAGHGRPLRLHPAGRQLGSASAVQPRGASQRVCRAAKRRAQPAATLATAASDFWHSCSPTNSNVLSVCKSGDLGLHREVALRGHMARMGKRVPARAVCCVRSPPGHQVSARASNLRPHSRDLRSFINPIQANAVTVGWGGEMEEQALAVSSRIQQLKASHPPRVCACVCCLSCAPLIHEHPLMSAPLDQYQFWRPPFSLLAGCRPALGTPGAAEAGAGPAKAPQPWPGGCSWPAASLRRQPQRAGPGHPAAAGAHSTAGQAATRCQDSQGKWSGL